MIKRIGVTLSAGDDSICRDLGAALENAFNDISNEKIRYELYVIDAARSANGQYNQVDLFISSGYDAIIVDLIDGSKAYDIAKKAVEKGIKEVVFDRGGYLYTGRVQSLADGAREGGLKF